MDMNEPNNLRNEWLETRHEASWEICARLQELGVGCSRKPYQPLQIKADTPLALIQSWSVFRQFTHSRSELASWLDTCWVCSTPKSRFQSES
ncbi:MAG: Asr1405/Asl0597 family protein [Cyanobacteria bacterium P01_E01_bin.6]